LIASEGGIEAVLDALRNHTGQNSGCGALCGIDILPANKLSIAAFGGIEIVLQTPRKHLGQVLVQKRGLLLLRILAVNDDIAVKIADTEGIEVVIDAIRTHTGNAKVHQRACRALLEIGMSNTDVQTQMKKLGVIEAIKEIMNAQNATPKCRDTGHTGTP